MTDKKLEGVLDTALESIQEPQEEVAEQVAEQMEAEVNAEEKPQDKNFKQLRNRAEKAEQERDEVIRINRQYEAYMKQFQQPQQQQYAQEPEEQVADDDDIVDERRLKKTQKKLEEKIAQLEGALSTQTAQQRVASKHNDFHSVVTEKNINKLIEQYPQIARTLETSPDFDSKLESAYLLIRKLVLEDSDKADKYEDVRSTAQANNAKPKTATSIQSQQNSALAKAHQFQTEADREKRRRQVEAEMDSYSRGYIS